MLGVGGLTLVLFVRKQLTSVLSHAFWETGEIYGQTILKKLQHRRDAN